MSKKKKIKDRLKLRKQKAADKKHKKKNSIFKNRRNRYLLIGVGLFAVVVAGLWAFVEFRPVQKTEVQQEAEAFSEADRLFRDGKFAEAAEEFEELARSQTGETKFNNLMRAGEAWQRAENFDKALNAYNNALDIPALPKASLLEAYSFVTDAAIAAEQYDVAEDFVDRHEALLEELPEDTEVEQIEERLSAVREQREHIAFLRGSNSIDEIQKLISEYESVLPEQGSTISGEDIKPIEDALRAIVEFADNNTLPEEFSEQIENYRTELERFEEYESQDEPPSEPPPGAQQ